MSRLGNRTAHIKPSTRNAMLNQLAAIADGIIEQITRWRHRVLGWAA